MRRSRVPRWYLGCLAAFVVLACIVLRWARVEKPLPIYEEQFMAAEKMLTAYEFLWAACPDDLKDPSRDPNRTGLIGPEFGDLLTTLGSLTAKRTATNPDFAALFIRWFWELGLGPGDRAVLACSSSFPALILAAVIAAEVMDLEPFIMLSLGASSYGATSSQWTWLDMEEVLYSHGLIRHRTTIVSLGGEGDVGSSLSVEGKENALAVCKRHGISPLIGRDFQDQLAKKLACVRDFRPEVFVNIGGNQVHIGEKGHLLPSGVIHKSGRLPWRELGLAGWCLKSGVPVIHLLRIEEIALRNGLKVDPIPLPSPGSCPVYFRQDVHWIPLIPLLAAIAGFLLLGISLRRRVPNR